MVGNDRERNMERISISARSIRKGGTKSEAKVVGGANYLLNEKVTDSSLELEELVERWNGPRRGWRISSGGGGLGEGGLATSTSRRAK